MNWHNEPWRKLYTRITGDWTQLSVMARGISCELLKYAKDDGSICKTRGKDPDLAVALVLAPTPEELEAVTEASRALRLDGYLALRGETVYIRNFGDAQLRRTPAAVRQRRYRENKKISLLNEDDITRDITRDQGVTLRADNALPGSETRRYETSTEETHMPPLAALELIPSAAPALDYDALYAPYPRKEGKARGMAKLKRAIKTPAQYERFANAVRNYAKHVAGRPVDKVKQFDSFLSCWEDYVDGVPFAAASGIPGPSRPRMQSAADLLAKRGAGGDS